MECGGVAALVQKICSGITNTKYWLLPLDSSLLVTCGVAYCSRAIVCMESRKHGNHGKHRSPLSFVLCTV